MNKPFPELRTARLLLRQIWESDIHNIHQGLSNPIVTKFYGVHFDTLEETREQLKWYKNLETSGTGTWWAICSNSTDSFYGAAGFNNIEKIHGKGEIGFWLLPEYWGRGYMQEALHVLIDFGHRVMDLHRIEAFVESPNTNAHKVFKSHGFNYEGTMEDCERKGNGFISLDIYASITTSDKDS